MITILFVLVIIGVLLYLVESVIPMDPSIKLVIRVLVLLLVLYWVFTLLTGGVALGTLNAPIRPPPIARSTLPTTQSPLSSAHSG